MITSTANQQVKQLIQLHKKSKLRNAQDVFVAEGIKMFREAPRDRIEKVYMAESLFHKPESAKALEGIPYEIVEDSVFKSMCDTQTPQGVLCVMRQYHYSMDALLEKENAHLILLENIQDPGNLGTIMRTAEGAGVTGVILSSTSVDMYNPKTIRSTMGSVYRVPFIYVEDLKETVSLLKQKKITTYAAHLKGTNTYDKEDYTAGTAFLIGNESNGLSEELSACADTYIRIPMEGKLESLNAAVAASILMYEVCRQRR